jgi:hypothetical protein
MDIRYSRSGLPSGHNVGCRNRKLAAHCAANLYSGSWTAEPLTHDAADHLRRQVTSAGRANGRRHAQCNRTGSACSAGSRFARSCPSPFLGRGFHLMRAGICGILSFSLEGVHGSRPALMSTYNGKPDHSVWLFPFKVPRVGRLSTRRTPVSSSHAILQICRWDLTHEKDIRHLRMVVQVVSRQ